MRTNQLLLYVCGIAFVCCSTTQKVTSNKIQSLCVGDKPAKKFVATLAVYQGVPQGMPLDEVEGYQSKINEVSNYVIQNFFSLLSQADGKTIVRIEKLDKGGIHLVRINDKPLQFVVCESASCENLKEPFTSQIIKKYKYESQFITPNGFAEIFYIRNKNETSMYFYQPVQSEFHSDPFNAARNAVDYNLNDLQSYYILGKEGEINQSILKGTTINKNINGKWLIQQAVFNPKDICKNARPNSHLLVD